MDWLKKHYEKLIFGLFLAGLLVWCVLLYSNLSTTDKHLETLGKSMDAISNKNKPIPALKADVFQGPAALQDPNSEWKVLGDNKTGTLFDPCSFVRCKNLTSCQYLLPYEYKTCPYCKTNQGKLEDPKKVGQDSDNDGITDVDEAKYPFLDANNPDDAWLDEDKDGFSNREEILAGTNPADPKSFPNLSAKLRFEREVTGSLPVVFTKLTKDGADQKNWVFAFDIRSRGAKVTKFGRLGEKVGDYRILAVSVKEQKTFDQKTQSEVIKDTSEVTVQREGDEPAVLELGKRAEAKTIRLQLLFIKNGADPKSLEVKQVKVGEEFPLELKDLNRKENYVVKSYDASTSQVIVQQVLDKGLGPEIKVRAYNPVNDLKPKPKPLVDPAGMPFPEGVPPTP